MILVKAFFAHNELRNYSYLVLDDQTGSTWVIDPYEAKPLIDYIKKNGLVLQGILNTHQHFDHIRGNAPLMAAFNVSVYRLRSHDNIRLDEDYFIQALDTPGHTLDHQAFIWKKKELPLALFSGDTLFNSGVGNCRGGGNVELLFETTSRLMNLPKSTILYPGHDYRKRNLEFAKAIEPENKMIDEELKRIYGFNTEDLPPNTLGDEMEVNPFLRLYSDEIKENLKRTQNHDNKEVFIELRKLRDQW